MAATVLLAPMPAWASANTAAVSHPAPSAASSTVHRVHPPAKAHARAKSSRRVASAVPPRPAPPPPDAAPIPDRDIQAPVVRAEDAPVASPTLFQFHNQYRGDGYIYGSSPQGFDDRHAVTVPGVNFSVPLR
jgi:hypothetical protein